jgi:hypothetical protein
MTDLKELAEGLADELAQAGNQLRQYRAIKSADCYASLGRKSQHCRQSGRQN